MKSQPATMKNGLHLLQLEKAFEQQEKPSTAKRKKEKKWPNKIWPRTRNMD